MTRNESHDLRRNVRRWLAAGVVVLLSLSAQAGGPVTSDRAFGVFMGNVTGQNKQTVGFAKNGTPTVTPGVPTQGAPDGGPGIKVTSSGTIRNPAGNSVTIAGTGRVSNAVAAKAIGRFMARVGGATFVVVGYAVAVKQLLAELGYGTDVEADGSLGFTKPDPNAAWCTVAPCYEYRATAAAGYDAYFKSRDAACDRYQQYFIANNPGRPTRWANPKYASTGGSFNQGYCNLEFTANGGQSWLYGGADLSARTRPVDTGTPPSVDATLQEVQDAIAARSGWPTSSNIAQAAAEAKTALQAMPKVADAAQAEEDWAPLNVVQPLASGPATSPGRVTTQTSNNPDGSQRSEQVSCQYKHAYNGADVTTTEECTTTVLNDGTSGKTTTSTKTDNAPTPTGNGTTTTTTTTPDTDTEQTDPCEANPDRVGCAEFDTPSGEIPKAEVSLTYSAESPFGGGSCPANKTMELRGKTITVINWTQWCSLTATYVRPIIILLATISAFFIVAIGRDAS